jgi:hypothetical protein
MSSVRISISDLIEDGLSSQRDENSQPLSLAPAMLPYSFSSAAEQPQDFHFEQTKSKGVGRSRKRQIFSYQIFEWPDL